jgi:hypothetical protein
MATLLTNQAKVEARLSAIGVSLRIDHDAANAFNEAISQASADVLIYLNQRYTDAELAGNDWVTGVVTDRAIFHLSRWRNNTPPKVLFEMWDEAKKMLMDLATGRLNLPGVDLGDSRAPQYVQVTANYGFYPSIRRVKATSTNTPKGYASRSDPFEPEAR